MRVGRVGGVDCEGRRGFGEYHFMISGLPLKGEPAFTTWSNDNDVIIITTTTIT